jgi:hypothetical protein
LGHYLIAMKMKLSEAYLQCQDKSGRLGGVAGSVVWPARWCFTLVYIKSIIDSPRFY